MIYLASPYSSPDPLVMRTRFLLAEQVTATLIGRGHYAYSPIVHCHEMAQKYKLSTDFGFWRQYCLDTLRFANALFILKIEGWDTSTGVTEERSFATILGIPMSFVDTEGDFC